MKQMHKIPKYFKIQEWLTERIASGQLAQGTKLPSEHELMQKFEVSRVTTRQAINHLQSLGLIESRQGKGHYVLGFKAVHDLDRLQSFGEMMLPMGVQTKSDVIELLELPASTEVASALKITKGERVTRIVRNRIAAGMVLSLDISYFHFELGRKIQTLNLAGKDIFVLLEQSIGIALGYADLEIDVVKVPERLEKFLQLKNGEQVMRIRRLTHDINGKPIDFEYLYSPLTKLRFRIRSARW